MPFEFSFIALAQLVSIAVVALCLWKALGPLFTNVILSMRNVEGVEITDDPLALVRWKWLIAVFVIGVLRTFNPVDFSISEDSEREKQEQMATMREFKKDIPPRVEVEERTLDKALEEFDDAVDAARVENQAEQTLKQFKQ